MGVFFSLTGSVTPGPASGYRMVTAWAEGTVSSDRHIVRMSVPLSRHAGRKFAAAAGGAALLTVAFGLSIGLGIGEPRVAEEVDEFGKAAAAAIAAVLCGLAALRHSGRSRVAWALLGGSAAAWDAAVFPAITDVGHIGAIPLALGALAVFPRLRLIESRLAFLLDGSMMAAALLV